MKEKLKNGVTFTMTGRSGKIYYKEANKQAEFYVEMSGNPEYHILVWFEETTNWTIPNNERINRKQRHDIKQMIVKELARQNLKSDIDGQN